MTAPNRPDASLPVTARTMWVAVLAVVGCVPPAPPPTRAPAAPSASVAAPTPHPWGDEVLYFVVLDRFADGDPSNNDPKADPNDKGAFHGGDLVGLTQQLDEIASLGATAIWITPVVRNIPGFVTGAGFPDYGYHGYWADDFTQLDPRFGTEAELKALVAAAHQRGMKVVLDVVYNHAGYGTQYEKDPKTRDWLRTTDGSCGQDELTMCLLGLPDFKTEREDVADFLMDAHLGWAKRSGVDGFRLDTLKHVDHPFWQEHRRRVRAELGPDFFLLGEMWGGDAETLEPWFSRDEIDAGFDFAFQGSVIGFLQGRGRSVAFDRYLQSRHRVRPGYLLSHFLSSHDVPGALHQLGGDKDLFKLAAILQLTTLGMPMVYYGEEVGRPSGEWPHNRSNMPWGEKGVSPGKGLPRDEALRAFYRTLIAARRSHPALTQGTHEPLVTDPDVYAFARRDPRSQDGVVVVVNRGANPQKIVLQPLPEWGRRPVTDLLTGREIATAPKLQVELAARGAAILATPAGAVREQ